ncbi:DUF2568 domain-containing protein [Phycicoccus sp. 3266]|uniref:DUF2568 domain-containing protein n=1 Tax=Phycicoccus sp. 3266 TaxID=2817751 RepID=UPI0028641C30|nr:DUF2568 domain-containing protein [Phycicoccus sp. 3266]MDR6863336.1 hypothetical protein [Phycicoccus sp. 3266]
MAALGWLVLALVFLDEVLAAVAAGVWGSYAGGWSLAVLAPVLVVAVWWAFASPRARWGGPVVRPAVKVLVFGLASLGLWVAGHHGWAVALLVFSVVVNGLAQLPSVRGLVTEQERPPAS